MKKYIFLEESFYILTFAIIVFSLIEFFWPRLVLAYINLNYVLLVWFICGILLLTIKKITKGKK